MDLELQIAGIEDMLRAQLKQDVIDNKAPAPVVALLITRDPRTGEPLPRIGALFVVLLDFASDEEKDRNAMKVSCIAIAGEALASIFVAESHIVVAPSKGTACIRPSQHPERMECIMISTERVNGTGKLEYTAFRRDQGAILFDDPIAKPIAPNERGGRFVVLPPRIPPADVVSRCRAIVCRDGTLTFKVLT
jgi:hypothetical protein